MDWLETFDGVAWMTNACLGAVGVLGLLLVYWILTDDDVGEML